MRIEATNRERRAKRMSRSLAVHYSGSRSRLCTRTSPGLTRERWSG